MASQNPIPNPNVAPQPTAGKTTTEVVILDPFTCPWAMDGLRRALEGMGHATAGVEEYHIGTRGLKYVDPAKQIGSVGWWNEMVKLYCGVEGLPNAVTGRNTACRVIPRDV